MESKVCWRLPAMEYMWLTISDQASGLIYASLAPYWAKELGPQLHAFQASERMGEAITRVEDDRVLVTSSVVKIANGEVLIPSESRVSDYETGVSSALEAFHNHARLMPYHREK